MSNYQHYRTLLKGAMKAISANSCYQWKLGQWTSHISWVTFLIWMVTDHDPHPWHVWCDAMCDWCSHWYRLIRHLFMNTLQSHIDISEMTISSSPHSVYFGYGHQKLPNIKEFLVVICSSNLRFCRKKHKNTSPAKSTGCTSIKFHMDIHMGHILDITKGLGWFDQKYGRQSRLVHWHRENHSP